MPITRFPQRKPLDDIFSSPESFSSDVGVAEKESNDVIIGKVKRKTKVKFKAEHETLGKKTYLSDEKIRKLIEGSPVQNLNEILIEESKNEQSKQERNTDDDTK